MTSHDSDGLWSLARGKLSADEAARVRSHVRECAECARTLASMEASAPLLATHAVPSPGPEFWSRVDRGVLTGAERALGEGARPAWLRWSLLGGVAALAVVTLLMLRSQPVSEPVAEHSAPLQPEPEPAPQPAPVEPAQVLAHVRIGNAEQALGRGDQLDTPPGVEARLALPGSQVFVMPETQVSLAEVDTARSRLELARGTLAVDAEGELAIRALQVDIVVAGSTCVVHAEERGAVQVAVRDGVVRVRAGAEERELTAGRAVTIENARWQLRSPLAFEQRALERLLGKSAPSPAPQPPTPQPAPILEPAPEPPAPSVSADAGASDPAQKPAAPRGNVRVIRNRLPFAVQPETLDKVLPQPPKK